MRLWAELTHRARWLLQRRHEERELHEELAFHLEMETAKNVRRGMTPDDARRAARLAFGGVARVTEEARDARGVRPLEDAGRDVRYALRVLRRNPGFTLATVLTFALGIGAATAIFSVVYGVVLRPLPYRDPARLVALWERNVPRALDRNVVSVPNFEAWRERARSFDGMAALVPAPVTLTDGAAPERIAGAEVSPGYFGLLGVAPALGREFTAAEGAGAAAPVVILSDGLWRRRFGADPAVLGRRLMLGGEAHTVVGVMPARFDPPRFGWLDEQQLWLPFAATPDNRQWGRFLLVVARLRDGVTVDQARQEMTALAARRALEEPADRGWSASVVPLAEQITGEVRSSLLVLLGAVGLLLLIAVVNVAMLALTQARRRAHELAVRRAIGATRGRLLRQLFTQSALLGATGAALGVGAAWAGMRALLLLLPPEVPRTADIRLDAPVLLCATAVALLAIVGFGTAAALRGAGTTTRVGAPTRVSARLGGGSVVVAEVALGLVLAVTAGLMVRSFAALRAVDLGFEPARVVVGRVALGGDDRAPVERRRAFFDALLARLRATPGVAAAGVVSGRPFGGIGPATSIADAARLPSPGAEPPVADVRWADRGYFAAMRIPVVAGTLFDARESTDGPPRVVINEAAARALWPSGGAVGRRVAIQIDGGMGAEVIGVVGDVHLADARTPPRPTAYLAAERGPAEVFDVVLRGPGHPAALVAVLRAAVAELDPGIPVHQVTTMDELVARSLARDRFATLVLTAFAASALLLAAVGIYGVFAADVARRRREIGIRRALGARTGGLLLLVLRRGLARAAAGVAIGGAVALLLTRLMATMLFGVGPADPVAFVTVAAILLGVAGLATLLPAVRASRVSPMVALREE